MHGLFGLKHLIILIVSTTIILTLSFFLKRLSLKTCSKALFYIGIISETLKIFYYILANEEKYGGTLPKSDLPFHLCSIQIIFIAIVNFSENEKLKKFLQSFMLPSCLFGGIAALLVATSSSLNGGWVITAQYFLYHIAIILYALKLFQSDEFKLELSCYFNCLKFLGILMFFSIYINSILYDGVSNINFMYVVSPPAEGLPYLNENDGWFAYIVRYALLIIVAVTGCYIKPIVNSIRSRFSKEKDENKEKEAVSK